MATTKARIRDCWAKFHAIQRLRMKAPSEKESATLLAAQDNLVEAIELLTVGIDYEKMARDFNGLPVFVTLKCAFCREPFVVRRASSYGRKHCGVSCLRKWRKSKKPNIEPSQRDDLRSMSSMRARSSAGQRYLDEEIRFVSCLQGRAHFMEPYTPVGLWEETYLFHEGAYA